MYKYVLNTNTGTLHEIDNCCHSKGINKKDEQFVFFKTYEASVKSEGMYKKDCRICFNGK
ncbi:MAG: hypothetical protein J6P57_02715 [Lachnospiraceae bacterium]|nr:hypothetical protein [Lachnospiraceae bacterium]